MQGSRSSPPGSTTAARFAGGRARTCASSACAACASAGWRCGESFPAFASLRG